MEKTPKMKKMTWFLSGLFCLLWTAGCSTLTVKTNIDPMANFSGYKTYGWMAQTMEDDTQIAAIRKEVGPWIEADVERELDARGFTKKTDGRPDFFLAYHGHLEEIIESYYVTYRCGPAVCGETEIIRKTEGTLILDVIDAEKNEVVWRGTSVGLVAKPHKARDRIEKRVKSMLKDFPPR